MATFLDIAGVEYPATYRERSIKPLEGVSMLPTFSNQPHNREVLTWEHEGNRAIRKGRWKMVNRYPSDWELYDIEADRTEMNNLAAAQPQIVEALSARYQQWAERCNIMPWAELLALRQQNPAWAVDEVNEE